MNRILYSLLILGLLMIPVSCTGDKQPTSPAAKAQRPAAAKKTEMVKPVLAQEEEQSKPAYQVIGLRDPFQPFSGINPHESGPAGELGKGVDPLQRLSISQVYLVGVILGKQRRALIQDSSGMGYIITEGTLVGENNGIITKIEKDAVTVKQHFKDYMGRVSTREVVLALRKEEGVK
jgi:type IV pilus assembly protein PilP